MDNIEKIKIAATYSTVKATPNTEARKLAESYKDKPYEEVK